MNDIPEDTGLVPRTHTSQPVTPVSGTPTLSSGCSIPRQLHPAVLFPFSPGWSLQPMNVLDVMVELDLTCPLPYPQRIDQKKLIPYIYFV